MENILVRSIQISGVIISILIVLCGVTLMAFMTYFHLIHVVGLSPQEAFDSTIIAVNMTFVISVCMGLYKVMRKRLSD